MKKFFFNIVKNIILINNHELFILLTKLIRNENKLNILFNVKKIIKNVCFDSGIKRSFNSFFFLSRMSIKKYRNLGLINGLKKIT